MLVLKNITKEYAVDTFKFKALNDVSLAFRENEFVSILGPSGSGKTTLLNIIGGLDHYTSGDLIINGKSTKDFTDTDWDTYRNHSIGFVFQSYNLIPHQSVLANVELALTLSGVSRKQRREKARQALIKVGLGDQLNKRPNQMSGGQMQRVAIARALVNDPDILLADEPTGALDSATSVQIMELLKEVSKNRLVIMVTHNPELAQKYSTRIISLKDGVISSDTQPCVPEKEQDSAKKEKKTSMSFFTALSLSLNNLMTKKARTFLTSFAGSIGIIGIALILALSSGIKAYINDIQEETLSSYPIQIDAKQVDMSSLITGIMGANEKSSQHDKDAVYVSSVMYDLANSVNNADVKQNDLKKLKEYFENGNSEIDKYARSIQYYYSVPINVYAETADDKYQKGDIMEVFSSMGAGADTQSASMSAMYNSFSSFKVWAQLLEGENSPVSDMVTSQYELVAGAWPKGKNDILLVLDKNNEITDITLHALGLKSTQDMISDTLAARSGKTVEQTQTSFSYEDILNIPLKLVLAPDYYTQNGSVWQSNENNTEAMDVIIANGLDLNICGIIRPTSEGSQILNYSLYYTSMLTDYIIEQTNNSDIVKAQLADQDTDVFTSLPFISDESGEKSEKEKADELREYFASLNTQQKADMYLTLLSVPNKTELKKQIDEYMASYPDRASLEKLIFDTYSKSAGVDEASIRSFIEGYSDDELRKLVEDQIRQMLVSAQKEKAQATINAVSTAPSEADIDKIKSQILAKLPDRNSKTMYIVSEYTKTTALDAQTIMSSLAAKSDAQINDIADSLASKSAAEMFSEYAGTGDVQKVADAFDRYVASLSDADLANAYEECAPKKTADTTYSDNLATLGIVENDSPSSIAIYTSTFSDKDEISNIISVYNDSADEKSQISYTDYVGLIMSSVTTIIDVISYVLIAFVSISLIVSSIMIGIITYISVLERTKEIGILRAIGASKRDVSRVFNAETLIIGFVSGAIGIIFTVLLCVPINIIIRNLSGIQSLTAYLPAIGAIILMLLSMFFTFIAGLFPSKIAAKKDPVVALRSE